MKLDQWLRQEGLTYEEFGERIGKSIPTVGRIARGGYNIKAHTIAAIERETAGAVTRDDLLPERPSEEGEAA